MSAFRAITHVVNRIVYDIQHTPNGYSFWRNLPPAGRCSPHSLAKRWQRYIRDALFTQDFKIALLQAILKDGQPVKEASLLYIWAVKVVYKGRESELYKDYFKLIG